MLLFAKESSDEEDTAPPRRRSARAGTGWAEDGASRSKGVITPHTGCADAGTGLSNALPFTAVRLTSGSSALARPADRVPLAAAAGTT